MRIGKMYLCTRIALLVAIVWVTKCAAHLDAISQEHMAHREEKGISQEHKTHTERKLISQEKEAHREGKVIQVHRTKLTPMLEQFLGIVNFNSAIDFDSSNCTAGECLSMNHNGGGNTVITGDGGEFFNPPSTAGARQAVEQTTYIANMFPTADVVQILLNISSLELLGPIEGDCTNDSLKIIGANPGLQIPVLCGSISNQQLYIDIDNSDGPYQIIAKISDFPTDEPRKWDTSIRFLREADAVPRRCLQYHTATEGALKSFNFGGNPQMVLNNQRYSICFGYVVGYCDIAFTFSMLDVGFSPKDYKNKHPYLNSECHDDYLLIGDNKYCGIDSDYPSIIANSTGPITVKVRTDSFNDVQAVGFSATYAMMRCNEITDPIIEPTNTTIEPTDTTTEPNNTTIESTDPTVSTPTPLRSVTTPSILNRLFGFFEGRSSRT